VLHGCDGDRALCDRLHLTAELEKEPTT
jgi:hypothetical protein